MKIKGFSASAVQAGIRYTDRLDLGLIFSDVPAVAAGVFTTNKVKAAPVLLDIDRLGQGRVQAVLVNSGNANACNGKSGMETALATSALVAEQLGIPTGTISVAAPGDDAADQSPVHYRGRAAQLADRVPASDWASFTSCPWEDLRAPGRVHVDSFGYLHICQGISIGNLFERPLPEIMQAFDPETHPIIGPLLAGGPAELVRKYDLAHRDGYADHCHLCFEARGALRERFPAQLAPDQMYGPV